MEKSGSRTHERGRRDEIGVVQLSDIRTNYYVDSIEMGAKIGATLWQELFAEFESKLHCGSAYVIQNIKVVENHSEYKVNVFGYSDGEMMMTVWEEYTLQLDDAIEKNHIDRKPLVVMLTLANIKDPKDKYPLSVQNIKHGSKLYVNTNIAEI
ncbi:hypothetical protein JHK82_047637 [Glycine max]|nr:hypothetical protein JHK82_047637 [Glycine max]